MPKCVIDILIVEPFTWHSVVSLFNCPRHPLPESLVYALQKKKNERQHYFLQKLTSRLKQGASYQYYKTRRCCQSVSQVSDVCQVSVHFPVPLTSHPLKKVQVEPFLPFPSSRPERRGWNGRFVLLASGDGGEGEERGVSFEGCRSLRLSCCCLPG